MKLAHGTVVDGQVVLDEPSLPDGTAVYVFSARADGPATLEAAELRELEDSLEEERRGEVIAGADFLLRLRSPGG